MPRVATKRGKNWGTGRLRLTGKHGQALKKKGPKKSLERIARGEAWRKARNSRRRQRQRLIKCA